MRVMEYWPMQFGRNRSKVPVEEKASVDILNKLGTLSNVARVAPAGWNCEAQCGHFQAGSRAAWLVQNRGLPEYAAQLQVMREFPDQFGRPRSFSNSFLVAVRLDDWDGEEFCEGKPAQDRAEALVKGDGLTWEDACKRVMEYWPEQFGCNRSKVSGREKGEMASQSGRPRGPSTCSSSTRCTMSTCGEYSDRSVEFCNDSSPCKGDALLEQVPEWGQAKERSAPDSSSSALSGRAAEGRDPDFAPPCGEAPPTTMMIRNIPYQYEQHELIEELDRLGFEGSFDFFFAPRDYGTKRMLGYAFVNFVDAAWALRCNQLLDGHTFLKHQQKTRKKTAKVSVAQRQGLEANIGDYEKAATTQRALKKRHLCGPWVKQHAG